MKLKWKDRAREYDWVFPVDCEEDDLNRIVFKMQLISHDRHTFIQDNLAVMEDNKMKWLMGKAQNEKLAAAVRGWENLQDDDGSPIEFTVQTLLDILLMPEMRETRNALIAHIDDANGLGLDTAKNL